MSKKTIFLITASLLFILASCSGQNMKKDVKKTLEDNPELITDLIKKHPEKFMEAFRVMAEEARKKSESTRQASEEEEIEKFIKSPMQYSVRADELIRGTKGAPITIVEYSDFQCPFCNKGAENIKELMDKYPGKIAFIYKHLPIDSIHPQARLASKYFEAIRIEYGQKAFDFHDIILKNQQKIRMGEKYLDGVVKEMKLDLSKVQKLVKAKEVNERISADEKEAGELGFNGTPGFLVNGIPVRGAYPVEHFEMLFNKLQVKL